jgi:hypothetical protein
VELGDFERRQLEDAKLAFAIGAVTPAVGLAALGLGIAAAGLAIGNTLDDLKKFFTEQKEEIFGLGHTDEEMQEAVSNSPADLNDRQMPNINPDLFPDIPDFSGMSAASIYNTLYETRARIQSYGRDLWLEENNLISNPFNRTQFYDNTTGILRTRPRAYTTVADGESVSMFTYQMCIRETAARRNQGRAGSTVAGLLSGWGVIASEAVWRVGNALGIGQESDWSSGDVTEAPAYIADPILDWCRTIVDFPGVDAGHFGTYDYDAMFSGDGVRNIASRDFIEDLLKIWSSIENTIDIDSVNNHLSGMMPPPPS